MVSLLVEDMIDIKLSSLAVLSRRMELNEVRSIVEGNSSVPLFPLLGKQGDVECLVDGERARRILQATLVSDAGNEDRANLPDTDPTESFKIWPLPGLCLKLGRQKELAWANDNAMRLLDHFANNDLPFVYVLDEHNRLLGGVRRDVVAAGAIERSLDFIPVPEIFDALHDAIIIIDKTGTISYLNHAYSRLLGVSARRIVGRKMAEVEPTSGCLRVLNGDVPLVNERLHIQSLDVDVVATITPIYRDGGLKGVISVFRDLEETLRLSRELERLTSVTHYLLNQLDEKNAPSSEFKNIIGANGGFKKSLSLAARVAGSDVPVMIRGENGVGKEIVANAIHKASKRGDKPLIRVNCAAIPENLLESELFGYEEGAFTGAKRGGKIGKFEMADGGTLFLDEIGDMNLAMQSKILRAVQEKEIERVGGTRPIPVDIRILSATHRDLETLIQNDAFREDLYYRLNVVTISIPPLRERQEDVLLFAEYFIGVYSEKQGKGLIRLSEKVKQIFLAYHWPGNVRELQNVVQHAVLLCDNSLITVDELPPYLRQGQDSQTERMQGSLDLRTILEQTEKETILFALEKARNNKSLAMRLLGINRRSFYDKLKKHGIFS